MPTFGETVIEIIWTIISSIIETTIRLVQLVGQLFGIVSINSGNLGAVHIILIIFVMAIILFGLFKFLKSDIKHLVIAFIILAALVLISSFLL